MKLLIKQRAFTLADTYDVYDEDENSKYYVKAKPFTFRHQLYIYDIYGNEIGVIKEKIKIMKMLPEFDIEMDGSYIGNIQQKFTFFCPQYEIDYNGWRVEGDFLGWNYDVLEGCSQIMHIQKEPWHWGDTYVINYENPAHEITGLLLVIAIDAANCTRKK